MTPLRTEEPAVSEMHCPICQCKGTIVTDASGIQVECGRCGSFKLSAAAGNTLPTLSPDQVANVSGWIRENQGCVISETRLQELRLLRTPMVAEKADKLLLFLARRFPKPGASFILDPISRVDENEENRSQYVHLEQLLGVAWAQDDWELCFLLEEYLIGEKAFLSTHSMGSGTGCFVYRLTPKSWAHLATLQQSNAESDRGFVAMWFDPSMNKADLAIATGIREAGYQAVRIDRHQHNNRIDDEIIAAIRRSKFVVADFTGQRGGVYFEAGFALGFGIPVIWLCRKDDLTKIHFDNRQYNFILWEDDKLDDLKAALRNRIEATIGAGPGKAPS